MKEHSHPTGGRPGAFENGIVLAMLILRAGVLLASPVVVSGDAVKYIAGAAQILVDGGLPALRVQPHGFSVLLSPVLAIFGESLPGAVLVANTAMDLAIVVALIALARARLAGGTRWIFCLACAVQPFTATMANAVYTEQTCMFLTFFGILALHGPQSAPHGRAMYLGGLLGLGIAGLLRTDVLVLNAILILAYAGIRGLQSGFREGILRATVGLAVFLLPPAIILSWQFYSTSEAGFTRPAFHCAGYMAWMRTWFAVAPFEHDRFAFGPGSANWPGFDAGAYPARAFDSPGEHAKIADLLGEWRAQGYSDAVDSGFKEIASEKVGGHPLRHFAGIPLLRLGHYWLNLDGAQTVLRAIPLHPPASSAVVVSALTLRIAFLLMAAVGTWGVWHLATGSGEGDGFVSLARLASIAVIVRTGTLAALGPLAWAGLMEVRYVLVVWPFLILLALEGTRLCAEWSRAGRLAFPYALPDDAHVGCK